MPRYNVCLPLTGIIYVDDVEADSETDAVEKAMESQEIKTSNIEEWEVTDKIVSGNVFYGRQNEAYAEEVSDA